MFSRLHFRLTLLYLGAGFALTVLIGAGTYGLLRYYFGQTTDRALQHTMAYQFRLLGVQLPAELAAADSAWYSGRPGLLAGPAPTVTTRAGESEEGEGSEAQGSQSEVPDEEAFDSELAAIFVLPLDSQGNLLSVGSAPLAPVAEAAQAADTHGHDWRTLHQSDGTRVRLLTYRLPASNGPAALQVGRSLADQDRILRQFLVGLWMLSVPSLALLGAASWWLAGRSLQPAQQAWERQQAFVANASHELRTPLTLMRASAEVARRGLPEGDDRRALLGDILQEVDHMSRLVEDQLLLARLDAGALKFEHSPIAVHDLLADVQRQFGRVAEEHGVQVSLDSAQSLILGDPTRLRQVVLILLDNALAHTPAGGAIRLQAKPRGHAVELVITDTGSGIAPEHLNRVFERFYRVEGAAEGQGGRSGLGLAIAKALTEAQQGEIRLESKPGQGTRVTLTFPGSRG
ncbi:MAG: ATP-binding protein [Anaerolineales bacterium]|nr:ATP-binding protein [Anaerolineales bacterium]